MVIEGSSDIIVRCEFKDDNQAQWLTFRNGFVLVLQPQAMALYKDESSIHDPLGNGLKAIVDINEDNKLALKDSGFVSEYSAGFVGLVDDKAILITPNDIQLFENKTDALHNRNEITRLALA